MRLICYYVIEKATNKKVYADCRLAKAEEFLQGLKNKESYHISHKWLSI